uniref:helix-turn-helix domain-containing protein n=1 Tax=Streptomyces lunaelactis TaxID=1535768 RepID=UPI002815E51E|nr:winged helix-turn-helix domain-containing protein [Streptomyces lunaelactis]
MDPVQSGGSDRAPAGHLPVGRGVWELLQRHGWSCQQPARRAAEQDQAAVAGWAKETWPAAKPPRRRSGHGSSLRTKPPSR